VVVETDDRTGAATRITPVRFGGLLQDAPPAMSRDRAVLLAVLILIGAAWGITQPFAKIAVSEGYRHFGIIFWQFALGASASGVINRARGRGLPTAPRTSRFMSSSR
jgi:hypothetical protein